MSFYTIVQRARGRGPLAPASAGDAADPLGLGAGKEDEWRKLCGQILRLASNESLFGTEVFFCLIGEGVFEAPDRSLLERLLTLAREHTWAAKIFLVAPKVRADGSGGGQEQEEPQADREFIRPTMASDLLQFVVPRDAPVGRQLADARESWQRWMEAAVAGRALDLLQLDYHVGDPSSIRDGDLRAAVDRTERRSQILRGSGGTEGSWRCVLDRGDRGWIWAREFLGELVQSRWDPPQAANLIAVVGMRHSDQGARALIRRAVEKHGGRCRIVAVVRREARDQPWLTVADLQAYCSSLDPELRAIEFHGLLELWYFLVGLNARSNDRATEPAGSMKLLQGPARGMPEARRVHAVDVDETPVFQPVLRTGASLPWEVFVTSAFSPDDEGHYLEAARDIGRFTQYAPFGLQLVVEPVTNIGRLIQAVERHPDLAVWIHLGHGEGCFGLREADTPHAPGRLALPHKWLSCFEVQKPPLAVAIFLTCDSAPIAERFARAGVAVTVGFALEPDRRWCRDLAVEVLKAVFLEGTTVDVILEGFRRGTVRVEVQEVDKSRPVAFFAARG